jgi:hypothetical protein
MPGKLPPLMVYPNRRTTLVLVMVCAALIAAPVVAVLFFRAQVEATRDVSFRLYAVIWIGIALFFVLGCLGFPVNLRRLVAPRPVLRISSDGVELLWYGLLRWEEVGRLAKVRRKGQWLLGIFPKDTEAVVSRQTRLNQALVRRAIQEGLPPFHVTQLILPLTIDEVLVQVRRYANVQISEPAGG